jgi:hypothetical protein
MTIIKIVLTGIAFLHGIIHLMGFVTGLGIAEVKGMTNNTLIPLSQQLLKGYGILWLVACVLFLITAIGLSLNKDWWRIFALVGIIISQVLIVIWWHDAKAGTIANIILLIAVIISSITGGFRSMVSNEIQAMFKNVEKRDVVVTEEMLAKYPAPVQKHLRYAGVVGRKLISSVRLKQTGRIRRGADQPWMDFTATQYYSIKKPGFVWSVDARMNNLPFFIGRDKYMDGEGHMLIKALGVYPVVDATGKEMKQGTMLRYLNELMWFPLAYLEDYLKFEAIDDTSAKVTFTDKGESVEATLIFDEEGKIKDFIAMRYMDNDGSFRFEKWTTPVESYGEFNGLRVPLSGAGVWKLPEGDLRYIELHITEMEFDKAETY